MSDASTTTVMCSRYSTASNSATAGAALALLRFPAEFAFTADASLLAVEPSARSASGSLPTSPATGGSGT